VEPKEQFGLNLRRLREKAGWTQMELGNRADMEMATISRLELGVRDPRLSTIVRVAAALGKPTEELVRGVKHPGPRSD
jgi:transcriptional regulator with XRE-family HTH domain